MSITDDQLTHCSVANKNLALNSIIGAAFGGALNSACCDVQEELTQLFAAAGQRCMAISVGE